MRIKRCVASRPGLFNNRTIEFDEGLTVIYGRNGSGKSLLARAIVELLWGSAQSLSLLKQGSWENLYLELELATSFEYRFVRNGLKELSIFGGNGKPETELFRGDPLTSPETLRDALIERLHSPIDDPVLREIYSATDKFKTGTAAFIPSPTDDSEAPPLAWEAVRFMLLNDSSGFYGLYHSTYEDVSGEHFLDEFLGAESSLKEIEKRARIIDIQRSRGDKIRKERKQIEDEIARIGNRLAALQVDKLLAEKLVIAIGKLRSIEKRITDMAAELRDSDSLVQNISDRETAIENRFPQFRDFTDRKKQNLKRLQETYRQIRDNHVAIDDYLSARRGRFRKATGMIALTGAVGIVLIYLIVNKGLIALPPEMRIYLLAGLAALLAFMAGALYLPLIIPRRPRELLGLLEERSGAVTKLGEIFEENGIELNDYRLESVYGFLLQYFEEYGEYTDGLLELFRLREGLKSPDYLELLQRERQELMATAGGMREEILSDLSILSGYGSREIDETRLASVMEGINGEAALLENKRLAETKILEQLEGEDRDTVNYDEELSRIEEERAEAEELYGRIAARRNAMNLIGSILKEVIERRESSRLARLAREARARFNDITENRHITEIDEDTIVRFIKKSGRLDEPNPAVSHLLLLAVQMTLSDFILESGGVPPPLLIDDPFLFMDDRRGEKLEHMLFDAAKGRQIIVFTQHAPRSEESARIEL